MARVALTSAAELRGLTLPIRLGPLQKLRACAERDAYGVHTLVSNPDDADVIVFADERGGGVVQQHLLRLPVLRRNRERAFGFCSVDHILPVIPGIYASIEDTTCDPRRHRSGHYLRSLFREGFEPQDLPKSPRFLASFLGAAETHSLRRKLIAQHWPGDILVEATDASKKRSFEGIRELSSPKFPHWYRGKAVSRYLATIAESRFVLCPRGYGTSSVRLFEAMQLGRAPVIISDAWVPCEGLDWDSFSIRVPQSDIGSLESILRQRADDAAELGRRARQAWEAHFSEESSFHQVVSWCLSIQQSKRLDERIAQPLVFTKLVSDPNWRLRTRERAKQHALKRLPVPEHWRTGKMPEAPR